MRQLSLRQECVLGFGRWSVGLVFSFKFQALAWCSHSEVPRLTLPWILQNLSLLMFHFFQLSFFFLNQIDLLRSKMCLLIEPRNHESIQGSKQISTPINILTYKTLIITSKTLKNLLETITTCSYNHYNLYIYKRIASKTTLGLWKLKHRKEGICKLRTQSAHQDLIIFLSLL